ncbi:hypothetical protein [Kaarinaea lacus]
MYQQAVAEKLALNARDLKSPLVNNDAKKLTLKLLQVNNLKEKQRLVCVFDQKILKLTEKTPNHTRSYMIDLRLLDEAPRRVYNINLKYLTAFLVLEVVSYTLYVLKNLGLTFLSSSYVNTAIALLTAGSIIMLLLAIKSFNNKWIFYTLNGRIPILELFNNNPNRAQFQKIFSGLIKNIIKARSQNNLPAAAMEASEVSEHRRLRDEGIITHDQYEKAKANILYGFTHQIE